MRKSKSEDIGTCVAKEDGRVGVAQHEIAKGKLKSPILGFIELTFRVPLGLTRLDIRIVPRGCHRHCDRFQWFRSLRF